VGGVQEVIRQIAERLVARGHRVTVATSKLALREAGELNGVVIKEFEVGGNRVTGMVGEVGEYQQYVVKGSFDILLIYAAQQWTFDALWPVLDKISCQKILVPCGFSALHEPAYAGYFRDLPPVLRQFNMLVFHASEYRDIEFARAHGVKQMKVIANGASERDFSVRPDPTFRARNNIPETSFLFLTVGSFTGLKGHQELAQAFASMKLDKNRHATLILNGNEVMRLKSGLNYWIVKIKNAVKTQGMLYLLKKLFARLQGASLSPAGRATQINQTQLNKLVLVKDFARPELIQAFMAADLFVFASHIEYSPLVLFEAAAAGTPFLSVNAGNAAEIARWTGAGVMCPSTVDSKGYTRVDTAVLAGAMSELIGKKDLLQRLGECGQRSWRERFTWEIIAGQYEQLFQQLRGSSH
jgi:glycosyltransferase involved in cell wall biosynthesis